MPYLSASEVIIHEEALYQVYVPLPFYLYYTSPRAGSGVVRIDPLRFLAGYRTRRLNQM